MRLMNFLPLTHGFTRSVLVVHCFILHSLQMICSLSLSLHQPASTIFTYLIRNWIPLFSHTWTISATQIYLMLFIYCIAIFFRSISVGLIQFVPFFSCATRSQWYICLSASSVSPPLFSRQRETIYLLQAKKLKKKHCETKKIGERKTLLRRRVSLKLTR